MKVVRASGSERKAVFDLVKNFYVEAEYPHEEPALLEAIDGLLQNETLGEIYLVYLESDLVGYAALTFGYSIEYGGRDAFIDEIYIKRPYRLKGLGKELVKHLQRRCQQLAIKALHLEVEEANQGAARLYTDLGFRGNQRALKSWRLTN